MAEQITEAEVRALLAAEAKATPGPWTREKPARDASGWPCGVAVAGTPGQQTIYANPSGGSYPSADCDLLVAARNLAAPLASSWLAMREREAKLVAWLEELSRNAFLQSDRDVYRFALNYANSLGFGAALAAKETGRE